MARFSGNVVVTFVVLTLCYSIQAISIKNTLSSKSKKSSHEFTCMKDGLYRNPENCNHFIECSGGHPYHMHCPAGLHYSTRTERCEAPCDAYCDQTLACNCGWSSCETTVTAETVGPAVPSEFVCEEDGQYRYPGRCTDYISCESGIAYAHSCPEGLHFSDITGHCVIPCESFCDASLACECEWPTCERKVSAVHSLTDEFSCKEDGVYPDPKNCRRRYYCSNGKSYNFLCDYEGYFHFDPVTKSCVTPCEAKCDPSLACKCRWPECKQKKTMVEKMESSEPSQEELDALCTEDDFFAYPHSCGQYIKCLDGQAFVTSCPIGLHFSNETKSCEEPCEALCDESLACHCGWQSCTIENSPLCEFDCVQDGIYKNPSSCSSFVLCSNGIAHVMRCPANLQFNEETKSCDYPCNAKCDRTLSCLCEWPSCSSGVCRLHLNEGNCSGYFPRWYYDEATSQCQPYVYTGCNGNENSFMSREECEKRCSSYICDLPVEEGNCTGYYPRYYFNKEKSICERFVYGGCEGNENRFKSKKECEENCGETNIKEKVWSDIDICSLKKDSGQCYGSESRYYFEQNERRCLKFTYTGCGGNENNFETKKQCEQSCLRNKNLNKNSLSKKQNSLAEFTPPSYCLLPPEYGSCRSEDYLWNRAYYNDTEKACMVFTYTGCEGNANNFENFGRCEIVCMGRANKLTTPFQCREDGFFPEAGKCSSYVECVNGLASHHECPDGLHFSEQIKMCVSACEAQCDSSLDCECSGPTCPEENEEGH